MTSPPAPVDFDRLFRLYHRDLGAFAYRRLRDHDAASDLVQDAFARYIAYADRSGNTAGSPRFFLWRIASNLVVDFVRRERRRGRTVAIDDATVLAVADPQPSAEQRLSARQEYQILKQALDELSYNQRAALLLNRVEGRTHAQIAQKLGVSASMANKYIMRALAHCAARLMDAGH